MDAYVVEREQNHVIRAVILVMLLALTELGLGCAFADILSMKMKRFSQEPRQSRFFKRPSRPWSGIGEQYRALAFTHYLPKILGKA